MAFTDEANFALKDMIIRSDFRLVDAEFRVGDSVARQRVSSLVQRALASSEAVREAIENPVVPPGVPPPFPTPPGPPVFPPNGDVEPEVVGVIGDVVAGAQVYTVRGDSSTATVFRGPNLIADGFLVRVSGALTHASPILSTDEGITFLVSDSDVLNSIGRLGGDQDLINMGTGAPVVGDHGIGLIQVATAVGHVSQSTFDVRFHHPVRAGQRLCVEQDVAVGLHFYAIFEVVQFAAMPSINTVIQTTITESKRVDREPAEFVPVLMTHPILPNRVVESLAGFRNLFLLGYESVGAVRSGEVTFF